MSSVYVHDFALSLGSRNCTLEESEAEKRILISADEFRKAGFSRHHICSEHETTYDLAKNAIAQMKFDPKSISTLIYATCLPCNGNIGSDEKFKSSGDVKYLMDFPASHLQADFELERASVIGLNQQACTSMLGSIRLAQALLKCELEQNSIICVTADRFPQGAHYEQAYNVISDGAAACVVSREPKGYKVLATHAITNGALAQASDDETVGSYFTYTHRAMTEVAEKASLSLSSIDWIIPQNTNIHAWNIMARLLQINADRVYTETIADAGHIISCDNVINLLHLEKSGRLKPGHKLLLFMAGFGLNWQALILERV